MKNYLLDTHVLLWFLYDSDKLSDAVANILVNERNVYISSVSFWEISLKYALGKLDLKSLNPTELFKKCEKFDFKIIPLTPNESASLCQLELSHHKNPFDRMLIWQSIQNNFILLSNDKNMDAYSSDGLVLLW